MEEHDLIILVYACYTIEKYRNQIDLINSTWGKKCETYKNIKLLYFLGEEKINSFNDTECIKYINLPGVKNDYLSASYKQFLGLKYIYENYKTKFIICVGTDTYLNIPKLLLYIDTFNYSECLYIGGHSGDIQIGSQKYYFHSGGPGFIITYNCLAKLYDLLSNLMENWITICNVNNNTNLIPACDVAISYYLQQPSINCKIIKTNDLSFINCNYKGYPCHINEVNISNIISCHLMSNYDFYNFTNILNDYNYFVNKMDIIKYKYNNLCNTNSDINEHLPTLYKYASKCDSIIELGVRGCISSWALVYGLLNNNNNNNNNSKNKSLLLNDINSCDIKDLLDNTKNLDINIKYEWINDLELDIKSNVDLTFIDTWHVYGHLKRELNKFSIITNKYIIMHDTTVDEIYGETIRCGWNANTQSQQTGIPVEEINCGLWKAIEEFLNNNTNWKLCERYTNNNGLTILERIY